MTVQVINTSISTMDPSGVYPQLMGKRTPNKTKRLMTNEMTITNIDGNICAKENLCGPFDICFINI